MLQQQRSMHTYREQVAAVVGFEVDVALTSHNARVPPALFGTGANTLVAASQMQICEDLSTR